MRGVGDRRNGGKITSNLERKKRYVSLITTLEDMLGSAKLSKMAGHMALHGCCFSTVQGARSSTNKGVI